MPDRFTEIASGWAWVQLWATLVFGWLFGESMRVVVSGASGGLIRWLMDSKRRIRDGLVAVVGGIICASYLSPLALRILEAVFGEMSGDTSGTAGFAAGLWGMSLAKIMMGVLEVAGRRISRGGDSDVA
ncbi:hypothetical protein [Cereibacter changlensis]|uniref:hypothetical protein n=1 Tax=Cereibacter changlensis TaxID=402884 RepID=UPI004034CE66